jgi:MFS transporter, DHA2 family, multidrug resistance protein
MSGAVRHPNPSTELNATKREWAGLGVVSLPCLLYAMDVTVLNLALPHITADLHATGPQMLWIIDIYGFVLAGLLITMGTLGDRVGRRRLLLIGAAAFGIASLLAATSNSVGMLIAARGLLGAAGATLAPSTLALVRHMFRDSQQRTVAIGVWTASFSIGVAIGPIIGGLLIEEFGWGAAFLIAVPAMLLLLVCGPLLLPECSNPRAPPMDVFGAAQAMTAVLLTIFGLKQVVASGPEWSAVASIAVGVVSGVAFIRRQNRIEHPLLEIRLLRSSSFALPLLAYSLGCFVSIGMWLFYTQYLQLVLGLSALEAGLWTLPSVVGVVMGSALAPAVARRLPVSHAMCGGLFLAAVGLAAIAQIDRHFAVEVLALGRAVVSLGTAVAFIPAINLMMSAVPRERAGEVSAISETGSEFGASFGVAVLGSIGIASYRATFTRDLPTTVGLTHADVQVASETLGGSFIIAARLSEDSAEAVIEVAKSAFHDSLQLVAALGSALFVVLSIVIILLMRLRASHARPDRTSAPA